MGDITIRGRDGAEEKKKEEKLNTKKVQIKTRAREQINNINAGKI